MPSDDNSNQGAAWPLPKFFFKVVIGDRGDVLFQEVSGLETETQQIEYRHGNSAQFSTVKMPGIAKTGNVTLKRGVFANDNKFWDWYNQIRSNTIQRVPVTIQLLDEGGNPTMTWTLNNAWPTKITAADQNATGNEVVVETIELAHEGMAIQNA
jgi:phage tail-like protein